MIYLIRVAGFGRPLENTERAIEPIFTVCQPVLLFAINNAECDGIYRVLVGRTGRLGSPWLQTFRSNRCS